MHDDRHLPYVCDCRQTIKQDTQTPGLLYCAMAVSGGALVTPSWSPAPSFALVGTDLPDEALERNTDRRVTRLGGVYL
jgi:hypothetical protein